MYNNKKIFILGMARSGYEMAKILAKKNNKITINDNDPNQDQKHIEELKQLNIEIVLGEHPDNLFNNTFDYLIKNPGIKNNHKYIQKANEYKIPVLNEVEVCYQLLPNDVDIVGITGTNGKTTTTTLIYEVLKKGKRPVHLCGNIGYPVSSIIEKVKPNDILVMEISNAQLYNFKDFKTTISILTNLSPAHIDFHGTYENYKETKKKIFNHHTKQNIAIINKENIDSINLTDNISSNKIYFSSKNDADICIKENFIHYKNENIINIEKIKVQGLHNYENIMCAVVVGKYYNISNEKMKEVFETFQGVEHRIEFVKEINNIKIYNDSKATNNKACQIALSAFKNPTIIIMGGLDRGQTFDELKDYMKNVKLISCYGQTKEKIKTFAESNKIKYEISETLEEATKKAYKQAKENDILLLSPACASWDQYKCFEDRGNEFKKIINSLK